MTTSTAYSYDQTRDQVITLALTSLGVIGPGGTPTGQQRSHAADMLNALAKSLDEDNKFTWRVADRNVTLVAGTASYDLGDDVLGVDSCTYIATGSTSRLFMTAITHDEFHKLPDLSKQGTPAQFWAERTVHGFTLHPYPVPSTTGTVEAHVTLRAKDYTDAANTGDFPQGWLLMLHYGLAALLAPAYGQLGDADKWHTLFEHEKSKCIQSDNEDVALQIAPWGGF